MKLFACLLAALSCAGCGVQSHEDYTAEVARLVKVGDPFDGASATMSTAGFDCRLGGVAAYPDALACDRSPSAIWSNCSEHLYIHPDAQKRSVARVEATGPFCAFL